MSDLLPAVKDLNEKIRALCNAHDRGAFMAEDEAAVRAADPSPDAVYQAALRRQLNGQLERLGMIGVSNYKPEKQEVIDLLRDPLGSETRATRRNVGALTVLAVIMAIAGRAPTKVPGADIGIDSHQWLFPLLLWVVIAYEFNAFRLYIKSDMIRRGLVSDRARGYLRSLDMELKKLNGFRARFDAMAANLRAAEGDDLPKELATSWDIVVVRWDAEKRILEAELLAEDGRRRWDQHVPVLLACVATVAAAIAGWRIYTAP